MAFLDLVAAEVQRAEAKHGAMSSHHEAYAVILEELDEILAKSVFAPGPGVFREDRDHVDVDRSG